jgi:hypothetical protein
LELAKVGDDCSKYFRVDCIGFPFVDEVGGLVGIKFIGFDVV